MIKKLSLSQLDSLSTLLNALNLTPYFSGDVLIEGSDPLLKSPHRLGEAISVALASNAVAASAIWEYRTAQVNHIYLAMHNAIHFLHPTYFIWQAGYQVKSGVENIPTNGAFLCKDGVCVMIESGAPYKKLEDGYLNFFNCGNNKNALKEAIAKWDSAELVFALNQRGLPACPVQTRDQWLKHPQGRLLAETSLIEIEKIAEGDPVGFTDNPHSALDGITVVDFTHVLAGPRGAHTLAEFGADVLHISSPEHPDTQWQNMAVNIGKRSAFLDLNRPVDLEKR